ncbi:MAG: hypothetical protein M1826_000965 [Phylliscum demangeonii]|nr:MAG: hypothetical protein M1826_000965 [Phylliscum demangeonii]
MDAIIAKVDPTSWERRCIDLVRHATNFTQGLVDSNGRPVTSLDESTWGINIATCNEFCSPKQDPVISRFDTFSAGISNYLLPWLALTAQLPYETGDPGSNLISFALAVGSPALITYSLTLTILNRFWVRGEFNALYDRSESTKVRRNYPEYGARVRHAQYLLQEGQQVPLRLSQERGWLGSLVVLPHNQHWWKRMNDRLVATRRGVTFSLVAQVLVAGIAWILLICSTFLGGNFGDRITALDLASGNLWMWLVPVIWGWIFVGTQYSPNSIDFALKRDHAFRMTDTPPSEQSEQGEDQHGIEARSGLNPVQPWRQSARGDCGTTPARHLKVPPWLGFDIVGDEGQRGPVFNYARLFTWWQMASTLERAFDTTLTEIEDGELSLHVGPDAARDRGHGHGHGAGRRRRPDPAPGPAIELTPIEAVGSGAGGGGSGSDDGTPLKRTVSEGSHATAVNGGLGLLIDRVAPGPLLAYPEWHELPGSLWIRMGMAAFSALVVQWGTTGSSLLTSYLTPVVGLGCRSGSHLLYGSLATAVWLLLFSSVLLSHAAMVRYQRELVAHPHLDLRRPSSSQGRYLRRRTHAALCAAAVCTRYLGRAIAVLNTGWIIVTSIFELVGFYENCWCNGAVLGLGAKAWVLLFKTKQDLKDAAHQPWIGGLVLSFAVWLYALVFFVLATMSGRSEA